MMQIHPRCSSPLSLAPTRSSPPAERCWMPGTRIVCQTRLVGCPTSARITTESKTSNGERSAGCRAAGCWLALGERDQRIPLAAPGPKVTKEFALRQLQPRRIVICDEGDSIQQRRAAKGDHTVRGEQPCHSPLCALGHLTACRALPNEESWRLILHHGQPQKDAALSALPCGV